MTFRIFLISTIIFSLLSSHLHAQTNIEKAFADLQMEMGGCQADLQSKNTIIGKATSELQRLDGLVTALKSDLEQKDETNKQLTEQVANSETKIASLQAVSNNAQACMDNNAKATQNLATASATNSTMKNQLELTTIKNQELIAENQSLKQQLLTSNNELTALKNSTVATPTSVKPASSAMKSLSDTDATATKRKSANAITATERAKSIVFEYVGCSYTTSSASCEVQITNEGSDINFSIMNGTRVIFGNGKVVNISAAKIANSEKASRRSKASHYIIKGIPVKTVMTFKGISDQDGKIFGIDIFGKKDNEKVNVSFRNLL